MGIIGSSWNHYFKECTAFLLNAVLLDNMPDVIGEYFLIILRNAIISVITMHSWDQQLLSFIPD